MTKSSHSSFAQPIGRLQSPVLAALAAAMLLLQGPAFGREVQLKVNNLLPIRLKANDTSAIQPQNGQSIAYFANDATGQPNRRTLQVRLAEPFLCADFSAGVSDTRLRLRLVQSNGDIQGSDIRGFAGLQNFNAGNDSGGVRYQYDPSNSNLSYLRVSTNTLVCYDFSSDDIFGDGFETNNRNVTTSNAMSDGNSQRSALADVDLVTSIRTPAGAPLSSARPGAVLDYVITVTNNGTIAANNVQVRDYFPKRTNTANGNPNGAAFDNGSWLCTASGGATCGATSGSDYVFLPNARIPAFGSLRISVSRNLSNSPVLAAGTPFSLQAAAFVAPSEAEDITGNNAISIPLTAVTNSNPILSIASNPPRTRGDCQSPFTNPCEFTVNVADDAPPESVTLSATSGDPKNLVVQTPASVTPALRRVRYTINPSFGGTVNVAVRGTDAAGGSTEINVPILVTDPPPTISDVANITRNEDNGAIGEGSSIMVIGPIAVTIGGVGVDVNAAQLEAVSTDTGVIPQSAIALGGSGANRTVTITVPRHAFNALSASVGAPSNITLTVRNGSASASDNFSVRLIAVNDPPVLRVLAERSFTGPISNLTGSIPDWLLEKSTGAANEANPPAGSGVLPQSLADAVILNPPQQTIPAILSATVSPSFSSSNPNTLQFRWVASPQPAGAACVFAEVSEVDNGQAGGALFTQATGKIRINSGDISCGAPPQRSVSK